MKKYLILIFAALSLGACKKETSGGDAPIVTFVSLTTFKGVMGKDTSVELVFKFNDANGDVSYSKAERNAAALICDTTLNDLMVGYEEKIGSDYRLKKIWKTDNQHACDTVNVFQDSVYIDLNDFIPDIGPSVKSSPIEGLVTKKIEFLTAITFSPIGRFKIYIKDRAKNKSNVITTPDFNFVP